MGVIAERTASHGELDDLRRLTGLDALQRTATAPSKKAVPDSDQDLERGVRRPLRCRACGSPITAESEWISVGGRRVHRRTNPYGFEFEFGCFRTAPGTRPEGTATSAYTWFKGFSWIVALCGTCGAHLGWRFQGSDSSFFGLVLAALARGDEGDPESGNA